LAFIDTVYMFIDTGKYGDVIIVNC